MNVWSITAAFLAATLTACQTPEPEPEAPVRKAQEVTAVQVHSLPPGCFVELNNEFLGVTPLTIRVPSYEGKWTGGMYKMHRLRASMPRSNGWEEKRWFGSDPIPKQVVFRIEGAEHYYHANSPKPPEKPTVTVR
jgi:hypothetical protein